MAHRELKMKQDVEAVIKASTDDPKSPFRAFNFCDESQCFSFEYKGLFSKRYYRISVSTDYPDGTVKAVAQKCGGTYVSQVVNERIPLIFNGIAKEVYKDMNVALPVIESTSVSDNDSVTEPISTGIEEEEMEDVQDQNNNGPQDHEGLGLIESQDSYCEDDDDYDYTEYDEDFYNDDEHNGVGPTMNPVLSKDIENVKVKFGESSISYRMFDAIDDIDVELHLPVTFLDHETAKAWRVKKREPIIVRLHLNLSQYLDASEPKVEVFQPSQKEQFGVGSQMRNIVQSFLAKTWPTVNNSSFNATGATAVKTSSSSKRQFTSQVSSDAEDHKQSFVDDTAVAKILSILNYDNVQMVRNALIIARGNIDEAIDLLVANPEKCKDSVDARKSIPDPSNHHRTSSNKYEAGARPKKFTLWRQSSHGASRAEAWGGTAAAASSTIVDDLNLMPSSTKDGKNAKNIPTLDYGYLAQVRLYIQQRLPTLNEFCVVCDEPHVFQNGAMLKPSVCSRELCVFAFQTLGVMADAAEDIATGAEVVDLLIAMANAACKSSRKDLVFDPYPTIVDPTNPRSLALDPKNKNYGQVEKALGCFSSMSEMMRYGGKKLKENMDRKNKLSYPLLQWIIASNRSHIVKLPKEKQLAFMKTTHQFLLMSSPPAKEALFREAKAKYGSTFAFHGSKLENWHSIMRNGLFNASGTKYQLHGAAHGNGIYLSPNAGVSFNYSGMGFGPHNKSKRSSAAVRSPENSRFITSSLLTCIALCEVVTSKELKKNGNQIWVVPNPDHVCTRFFFVYEDGETGDSNIDTQSAPYEEQIKNAVSYQYCS